MAEHDCSKHDYRLRVSLDTSKLKSKQHSNLIAALLRSIANYTDGYCATEAADDADLQPNRSMSFWLQSKEKRTKFDDRIELYFKADVNVALTRVAS